MKAVGWIVLIVGALFLLYGVGMDTSVGTLDGRRINNLGLMRTSQNAVLVGVGMLIVGAIFLARGRKSEPPPTPESALKWSFDERDCPHCAERIKRAAKVCKHCGRDVEPMQAG